MQSTAEEILRDREQAKLRMDKYESLKRLFINPDFKALILNGYLKDHALALVQERVNINSLENINRKLDAIAHLQQHLSDLEQDGILATSEYREHDAAYDKIFSEEQ